MNPTPKIDWSLPFASPESSGLCPERLQRIGTYFERVVEAKRTAGAITLVSRNGKICHLQTHGWLDVERQVPMREDALFRIYSMTKPITAVAVLMLYEEAAFLLDEPLARFLPEYADVQVKEVDGQGNERLVSPERAITIHDVLTHTAGFGYTLIHEAMEEGKLDLAEFSRQFAKEPLLAHPGKQWIYSAANDVLGRLVEVVSGRNYDQFLRERIFEPLGMTETAFWAPEDRYDRLVSLCQHDEDGRIEPYKGTDKTFASKPRIFSGGGGLVSSTSDYLRFCQMLLSQGEFEGHRLLGRKTVELMRQDHLPAGHPRIEPFKFGYGLGVSVVRSLGEKQGIASVGEFGWGGMASTDMWIDPEENMVTMIMMQLLQKPGSSLTKRYKDLVYQALV